MLFEPPTASAQIRYRGNWNAMYSYIAGDVVTYQGEAFIAQLDVPISPNPAPGNSPWVLMAAKGIDGSIGATGSAGATGAAGSGVPSGGSSNQVLRKASATAFDTQWVTLSAGDVGAAATSHTHSIDDVTNLSTTLNGKASSAHTHDIADVSGLQTALDGKSNTGHSHAASDISSGTISTDRLPIATSSVVGVVKPGTGLTVDGNGVLNSTVATNTVSVSSPLSGNGAAGTPVSVATATTSTLGVVRPDNSTITINAGVLSATLSGALSSVTTDATLTGSGTIGSPLGVAANAHTHAITALTGQATIAQLPVATSGTSSSTLIVRADDSRLSDARTPTSHEHNASDLTSGTVPSARIVTANNLTVATITQPSTASALTIVNSAGKVADFWVNSTGGLDIRNDVAGNTASTQFRVFVDGQERLSCNQGGVTLKSATGTVSLAGSSLGVPSISVGGSATITDGVTVGTEFTQGTVTVGDPTNFDGVVTVNGSITTGGLETSLATINGDGALVYNDGYQVGGRVLKCNDTNGTAIWADLSFTVNTQTFTSSGTWTKPAGAVSVVVEMCGGGAGGTSSVGTSGGVGGSGGVYETLTFTAGELTSTVSVTCGAGGSAGSVGGESLFGAFSSDANSYLRAPGGINSATQRTSSGIPSTGAFGASGLGSTTNLVAGAAGKYGGRGPGGGGGGGRGAAGGAGGKGGVTSWTAAAVTLGGGAAGGAPGSNGTNATSFHGRSGFGDGGGGGGGSGTTGGNGIRGGGGGGGGGGDGVGGSGGTGVVTVRTMCIA